MCGILRSGPPNRETWTYAITILDSQARALDDVDPHSGKFGAQVPNHKLADDAVCPQKTAGIEFWVSATRDQHGARMVDTIEVTALAQTDGLDVDAM
jgi:hypothetical protein